MNRQTALQAQQETTLRKKKPLFRNHTAVRSVTDHEQPINGSAGGLAVDLTSVPVRPQAQTTGRDTIRSCPISPQRCPFGGACHSCPPRVQAKLKIGQPGGKYEQEADRVADKVVSMPSPSLMSGGADSSVRRSPLTSVAAARTAPKISRLADLRPQRQAEVTEDGDLGVQTELKADDKGNRYFPEWGVMTSEGPLPGDTVPGYESVGALPAATLGYVLPLTDDDRTSMLKELGERVKLNGKRINQFYDNLNQACIDLIIELATEDTGLSFEAETLAGIISGVISAPLGPYAGLITGVIIDTFINIIDEIKTENDIEKRKNLMLNIFDKQPAKPKLAELFLESIAYTTWLQVAPLEDLWKFRIPPEFPLVSQPDIKFEIAKAIIKSRAKKVFSGSEIGWWIEEAAKTNHYVNNLYVRDIIKVRLTFKDESNPTATLLTHRILRQNIQNRSVKDLSGVPVVVEYTGFPRVTSYDRPESERGFWKDSPQLVVFGRDEKGEIFVDGDLWSLYYFQEASCFPYGHRPKKFSGIPTDTEKAFKTHYRKLAKERAKDIFRNIIDHLVPVKPKVLSSPCQECYPS